MEILSAYFLELAIVTFVILAAGFLYSKIESSLAEVQSVSTQISGLELVVNELKLEIEKVKSVSKTDNVQLSSWKIEQEQVSGQLSHRTKSLLESINTLKEEIAELENQQPEDKLYLRAQKMVKLGADVEEIIKECQLPKIEAEMLIAMHQKKSKQSTE